MPPLLEARRVRVVFRGGGMFGEATETVAVDDFSMSVSAESPSFVTIAGESGSGKTTIARQLLGLALPTGGQVLYQGEDVHSLKGDSRRAFRKDVQAIFQDPFEVYNPFYKVDHILTTPVRKFELAESKSEARELAASALETVGLRPDETLGRYPHQLSGGQRQRITIARALLLKPRLIIADEPVSMIDASLRALVLGNMLELKERHGISWLYITHDLSTARQISDRLVILYRGRVVEAGAMDQVLDAPQHPYTQLLIEAIPRPDPAQRWQATLDWRRDEAATGGDDAAGGCPFYARCPVRMERCRAAVPPLYLTEVDTLAACYLHETAPAGSGGRDTS